MTRGGGVIIIPLYKIDFWEERTQRGYSLYRGTHFKDNEGFEANWMQCGAF